MRSIANYLSASADRYLGYMSFALNCHIIGLDARGHHLVNLAIHILNALLLGFFLLRMFQTPYLSYEKPDMREAPDGPAPPTGSLQGAISKN